MNPAFPDHHFRRLIRTLRHFTEVAMDQWELWRFDSRHGEVFVSVRRFPRSGIDRDDYDDINSFASFDPSLRECRRCGRRVATKDYDLFEQMHYVCFHYEFEHGDVDIDVACSAEGCPSERMLNALAFTRFELIDHRGPMAEHHRSIVAQSSDGVGIEVLVQDEDRTLKVVLSDRVS